MCTYVGISLIYLKSCKKCHSLLVFKNLSIAGQHPENINIPAPKI
jgi:hypothetical protein